MAPIPLSQLDVNGFPELDTGIPWTILASFSVLLLCVAQGTLAMESSPGTRLSFRKMRSLFVLEILLFSGALAAHIYSFIRLRQALDSKLSWLRWEAPCLLLIALCQLLVDGYITLAACAVSRVLWRPLPAMFRIDPPEFAAAIRVLECGTTMITTALTLTLVGWRKRWWMVANVTTSNTVAEREAALSGGAEGFCVGLGILMCCVIIVIVANREIRAAINPDGGQGVFRLIPHMARPNQWADTQKHHRNVVRREATSEHLRIYRLLHEIRHGEDQGVAISRESKVENLARAPLHIGNAVIMPDLRSVLDNYSGVPQPVLLGTLLAEHFAVLPTLLCVTVAVVKLHRSLDRTTLVALNELVDAVIVMSFVEIGIGLKSFLWAVTSAYSIHENDIGPDDH